MTTSSGRRAPAGYRLRVGGHLDDHWSAWFGALTLTREHDGTTSLSCVVADQAELHGLLAKVRDLGVTLISAEVIEPSDTRARAMVPSRGPAGDADAIAPRIVGARCDTAAMTTSTTRSATFTLPPRGAFSLRESAEFGFGQRHSTVFDGTMRLAFCLDDLVHQVGVALTQDERGVHGEVVGASAGSFAIESIAAQTARMLSLDVDAHGYEAVAARDPVVARVLATAPGLRPPLFHSPYEAAAWCVLSLRWSGRQAAAVRDRLARAHGHAVEVAGVPMAAFPTPEQLLAISEFAGVPPIKIERLHGVARAAEEGLLDAEVLRHADPEDAMARLRRIPGIGPFSASLIVIRASGVCDVAVEHEPRLAEIVGRCYGLSGPATPEDLRRIGEAWRPFRTWVAVLLRAAAGRVPEPAVVG